VTRFSNAIVLRLVVACVVCILVSSAAAAQDPEPLPIEDALLSRQFGPLVPIALSPDGTRVAYTVQDNKRLRPAEIKDYLRSGLWPPVVATDVVVLDRRSGQTRNLTGGKADNWLPVWSPDGRYLAFFSTRDGNGGTRPWVWDLAKDELRGASAVEARGVQMEWTPDSEKLLITTLPESLAEQKERSSEEATRNVAPTVNLDRPTVVIYRPTAHQAGDLGASDPWDLEFDRRDLTVVDIRNGNTTPLVRDQRIVSFFLSPDGSRVAYTIPKRFERPGSQQMLFDLAVIGIGAGEPGIVASDIRLSYAGDTLRWSPDSQEISFRTVGVEEKISDCYVVDLKTKTVRNVTGLATLAGARRKPWVALWGTNECIYFVHDGALWQASPTQDKAREVTRLAGREITALIPQSGNLIWSPDGGASTIVVAHDDARKDDGFYNIDLATGMSIRLLERGECYTCANSGYQFTVTSDRREVVFYSEDPGHDQNLWASDATFRNPRQLTHLNPGADKYKLGAARLVDWLSDDGVRLRGALLLPSGYQEGERYPLIVWVYGGASKSDLLDRFGLAGAGPFNMQLLATRGYAVLAPDAPQRLGTPMADLAKTVLPGVNKVIEMGIADPERLGVMGHSYGGYSTLSLIVQTPRFKAALEADGTADLIGSYGAMLNSGAAFGTSVAEHGQGLMGGTPWEFRERYIENSPLFYLDRVDTPLLIVHGELDLDVASFLGDEVFVALRRLGKEVEYAKYMGEEHSPAYWSYANQVDFCQRMIAWFDVHLKPQAQPKPQVPRE
jgi:dipeptidyl aminopeptidase/acylaminoacyl peptidase